MRVKMKRIVLLMLVVMVFLTACSDSLETAEVIEVNTAQDSPSYVEGEDFQQNWNDWGSNAGKTCTMGEDGYYYYSQYGNRLLYFYDFTEDSSVPVCNQPNCEHNSASCNAILTGLCSNIIYIQYYEGNLYVIGVEAGRGRQDVCLYRISSDGAARGKVGTILTVSEGQSVNCVMHRGYVYAVLTQEGLEKQEINVYRLLLGGGEDTEIVYTFDAVYGGGAWMGAYGNYLYINHQYYTDQDANSLTGDLYRYQIHTDEMELVIENTYKPFVVDDSCIYYSTASQVLAYNIGSGETTELLDQGNIYLALEEGRLYCDNEFYISVLPSEDGVDNYQMREITVIDTSTYEMLAVIPFAVNNTSMAGICGTHLLGADYTTFYRYDLDAALADKSAQWEPMN